jgi:ribosome-binding ATPase YchF (GTP1/OBG family)
MKSGKRVRGVTIPYTGHYPITEIDPNTGEPLQPVKNAQKFVHHCGAVVRDRLSISIRKWKEKKDARDVTFVSDRHKELLWKEVIDHFGLPSHLDEVAKDLVRSWTMKKMATQFQSWKKLYSNFVAKNITPDFSPKSPYTKLQADWPEFVAYKTSEVGAE